MVYPQWLRMRALVVILFVSGCAVRQDEYDVVDGTALHDVEPSVEPLIQPVGTEQIGEAKEALSKWLICYKTTYAAAKLACGRTHTPPDVCHHFADALATRACQRFL